jgi:hypothetical protein
MYRDIQAYYDFYNVDKLFLNTKIVVIVVVVDEDFVEFLNEFVRSYLVNYDFVDFHRVMIEYYSYELVTMKDVLKLVMNNH